ncbi:hypothetical protein PAMP_002436 [Pampus punctatissimus]
MHLFLLIVGSVLLHEAYTLKCYDCETDATACVKESECPLQCVSTTTYSSANQEKTQSTTKSCGPPQQCVDISMNFGIFRTVIASKCCTTDLCNKGPAFDPAKFKSNGKKCYFCNGVTCTETLNCEENEDYCISGVEPSTNMTVKGCGSKMVCSTQQFKCCQGDLCNSASSTNVGILLLMAPLFSMVQLC